MFCVMICISVSVHPLTLFVAVTVQVPGAVTGSIAVVPTTAAPFDQEQEVPPDAVKEIEVVVHVNTVVLGGLMRAVGGAMFCVIICTSVSVHPLAAVAVTVQVPGAVTGNVAVVPTTAAPFDQEQELPPDAVKEIEVVVQLSTVLPLVLIEAIGNGFTVIVVVAVVAQKFGNGVKVQMVVC